LERAPQLNSAILTVLHITKQFWNWEPDLKLDTEPPDSTCQSSIFTQMRLCWLIQKPETTEYHCFDPLRHHCSKFEGLQHEKLTWLIQKNSHTAGKHIQTNNMETNPKTQFQRTCTTKVTLILTRAWQTRHSNFQSAPSDGGWYFAQWLHLPCCTQ
jgi:hypothetical protein